MADYKRLFIAAALASLALSLFLLPGANAEVRVCPQGCGNSSIQEALNAASPNETVVVESGTFRENFILGKSVALQGQDTGSGRPLLVADGGRIILAGFGASMQGFEVSAPGGTNNGNCTLEVVLPAVIYLNDFIGSKSVCPNVPSVWNSSQGISYQFNSRVLRSRMGNYWADYSGEDKNADGIGDEPMVLSDGNVDYYPLMQPVENYRITGEMETKVQLIRAKVGQPFTISLPANPTTAYEWKPDYDYYLLELTNSEFEKGPSEAIGAGGTSVFVFNPIRPGKTTIAFVYKRSWENIVADTRTYHVEIFA
jgi:predicted secreted protein